MNNDAKDRIEPVTVQQARDRLSEVKSILERLQPIHEQYHELSDQLVKRSKSSDPQTIAKFRFKVDQVEDRIEDIRQELLELDCVIKDFNTGLVDFVALRGKEPVWLCFKRGEQSLDYYHGWKAGFAGRQKIDFD